MITDEKFDEIQTLELEWWTNCDYSPYGEWSHYLREFKEHLRLEYENVADVGSGPIPFFCSGAFKYGQAVAIDPLIVDYRHIAKYRPYLSGYEYGMKTSTQSCGDGEFDGVFALNVIDHAQSPEQLMGELGRICRTGGDLFVFVDVDKPPDWLHPHMVAEELLLSNLGQWFDPLLVVRQKSWKFSSDALWYVGRRRYG